MTGSSLYATQNNRKLAKNNQCSEPISSNFLCLISHCSTFASSIVCIISQRQFATVSLFINVLSRLKCLLPSEPSSLLIPAAIPPVRKQV